MLRPRSRSQTDINNLMDWNPSSPNMARARRSIRWLCVLSSRSMGLRTGCHLKLPNRDFFMGKANMRRWSLIALEIGGRRDFLERRKFQFLLEIIVHQALSKRIRALSKTVIQQLQKDSNEQTFLS